MVVAVWPLTSVTAPLDGLDHAAIRVKLLPLAFFFSHFVTLLSMPRTTKLSTGKHRPVIIFLEDLLSPAANYFRSSLWWIFKILKKVFSQKGQTAFTRVLSAKSSREDTGFPKRRIKLDCPFQEELEFHLLLQHMQLTIKLTIKVQVLQRFFTT